MVVAAAATGILPMYGIQAFAVSHPEVSASACGDSVEVKDLADRSSKAACASVPASGPGDDRAGGGVDGTGHDAGGSKDEAARVMASGMSAGHGGALSAQPSAAPSTKVTPSTSSATADEEKGYGDDADDIDLGYGHKESGYGHDEGGYGHKESGYGHDEGGYGDDEGGYGEDEGGYGDTPVTKPPKETKPPKTPPTTPPVKTTPPTTPPASVPPHTEPPAEPPSLPETGGDEQVLAASGVAVLLLTSGAVLYRRGRAASRR
jgi:LPXTG-motif cell wall-anchored protein